VNDCATNGAEDTNTSVESCAKDDWAPPGIDYIIVPPAEDTPESVSRYPQRACRPPDR